MKPNATLILNLILIPILLFSTQVQPVLAQAGSPKPATALALDPIIELKLNINVEIPAVSILSHTIKDGYITKQNPMINDKNYDYRISLLDQSNTVIWQEYYAISIISNPPPLDPEHAPPSIFPSNVILTINFPYFGNARDLKIIGNKGNVYAELKLPPTSISTRPNVARLQSAPDGFLNLVILSDGFSAAQESQFRTVATGLKDYLLQQSPFRTRASQIDIRLLFNTQSLGCVANASSRLIICDWTIAKNVVTAAGLNDDKVIIFYNTPTYSGAGMVNGEFATIYNGVYSNKVITHEFTHTLGVLDEYDYVQNGSISNSVKANCLMGGTRPYEPWNDIVPLRDYFKVCGSTNWYRTSSDSRMRSIDNTNYNTITLTLVNSAIDSYAGAFNSDQPLPIAQITTPSDGSVVSGNIGIAATFINAVDMHRAELWVNSVLQEVSYAFPFYLMYDLGSDPGVNIPIEIRPYDFLNRRGAASTIIVNKSPTYTPTVTFTPTITFTPTVTETPTSTFTNTPTTTRTPTPTLTNTPTSTRTPTPTLTNTPISSKTPTLTLTNTPASIKTNTPTATNKSTLTPTKTRTPAPVKTNTNTPTITRTHAPSYLYGVINGLKPGAKVTFKVSFNNGPASLVNVILGTGGSYRISSQNFGSYKVVAIPPSGHLFMPANVVYTISNTTLKVRKDFIQY